MRRSATQSVATLQKRPKPQSYHRVLQKSIQPQKGQPRTDVKPGQKSSQAAELSQQRRRRLTAAPKETHASDETQRQVFLSAYFYPLAPEAARAASRKRRQSGRRPLPTFTSAQPLDPRSKAAPARLCRRPPPADATPPGGHSARPGPAPTASGHRAGPGPGPA